MTQDVVTKISGNHGSTVRFGCCSLAQSSPALCDPMDCGMPGLPVLHHLPELAQTHVHCVSDATQPSRPLSSLLLPSMFSSIRVFSSEPHLCIRWPNYWSFSFSISPANEYSGLISFRIDWLDLLIVQETIRWQNVVHWKREWQTTSAFLLWEPHEHYEKAKR